MGRYFLALVVTLWASVAAAQLPMGVPDLCAGSPDLVASGQARTLSGQASAGCLGIHGTVTIASNTTLTVTTILVYPDGELRIGSAASPASNVRIVFRDVKPTDPDQWGTGLLVFGQVTIAGQPKTAFLRSLGAIGKGATSLTLESAPFGWQVGDRLVIPGSSQHEAFAEPENVPPVQEWETVTIASVSGATIGLSAPTKFTHPAAIDADGRQRFAPHVGNLTRSVTFTSANPNGARGHVAIFAGATPDIRYAAFKDMGRTTIDPVNTTTNVKGRYAGPHLHMMGDCPQCVIVGNVVENSPKWGITIHQTNFATVTDNVIYLAQGSGIQTEDGPEHDNLIARNFIVASWGVGGDRPNSRGGSDIGFDGSGIWLHGPANRVNDNIIADSRNHCVMLDMEGSSGTINGVDPKVTPILEMAGNECYGGGRDGQSGGVTVYALGGTCCDGIADVAPSIISDTKVWHVPLVFYGYHLGNLTLQNWTAIGDRARLENGYEAPLGIFSGDYELRNVTISGGDYQHWRVFADAPWKTSFNTDQSWPQPGSLTIRGAKVVATHLLNIRPLQANAGGPLLGGRAMHVVDVDLRPVPGNPGAPFLPVVHDWNLGLQFNLLARDTLDWTTNGQTVSLYWPQQAPNYVLDGPIGGSIGSPEPGLTNAQLWSKYGKAMAGAVAPCSTLQPAISDGPVCGGVIVTPEPPPSTPPPSEPPPSNPPPTGGLPSGAVKCADEDGTCSFSGSQTVYYGAGSTFVSKVGNSPVLCNNATFGDPLPGATKGCWVVQAVQPPPPPPPADQAPTPIVSIVPKDCTLSVTVPNWSGKKSQVQRSLDGLSWSNHGSNTSSTTARTATVAAGLWHLRIKWAGESTYRVLPDQGCRQVQ